jgi:hypothetical protein
MTVSPHWIFDHLLPNNQVRRDRISSRPELMPLWVDRAALEASGLSHRAVYGVMDLSPHTPEAPYLSLVATLA